MVSIEHDNDGRRLYGNPIQLDDIPPLQLHGDVRLFQTMMLRMHEVTTELGLWEKLNNPDIMYAFKGRKFNDIGHTGYTFHLTLNHLRYIARHSWSQWVDSLVSNTTVVPPANEETLMDQEITK